MSRVFSAPSLAASTAAPTASLADLPDSPCFCSVRQKGSSESEPLDEQGPQDEDPRKHADDPKAPWPVRRGGIVLVLYENSLLILFAVGGEYLVLHSDNWFYPVAGVAAWILAIAISFLELLVQFLQAYVFALLNATYIAGALADEH